MSTVVAVINATLDRNSTTFRWLSTNDLVGRPWTQYTTRELQPHALWQSLLYIYIYIYRIRPATYWEKQNRPKQLRIAELEISEGDADRPIKQMMTPTTACDNDDNIRILRSAAYVTRYTAPRGNYNVYSIEAATRVHFIRSSRSPSAETITRRTTRTYSSLTADSLEVGYAALQDTSYINAGLPKRSDFGTYLGDQNIVAIGVSYTRGSSAVDKNGIASRAFSMSAPVVWNSQHRNSCNRATILISSVQLTENIFN